MARLADVDSSQALDAAGEMIVGVGPIDQPPAGALPIAGSVAEAAVILGQVGILNAQKMKFGFASGNGGIVFGGGLTVAASLRERH